MIVVGEPAAPPRLVCRNVECRQVVAVRVGANQWRSLGADVIAGDHGRQVFVCPVCGHRTRAPRDASSTDIRNVI